MLDGFSFTRQQEEEEAMVLGSSFLDNNSSTVRRQQQQHEVIETPVIPPFFNSTVRSQQPQHEALEIPPFFNSDGRSRGRARRRRQEQQAIGGVPSGLNIGRQQQPQQPIVVPPPVLNAVRQQQQRHAHAPQRSRTRRNRPSSNARADIIPPYPWATNRPAGVHSLEYLRSRNITRITHEVICRMCNEQFTYEFNLEEKFREVSQFIYNNKDNFLHRAPNCWRTPELPTCTHCEQPNSLKPLMPENKNESEKVNWLFLLLGQLLGLCTLEQLKYFCQHTKNHRTGAKDRVLFLTYLGLCKQVDPMGPYDLF
ncbi:hydroxyproline-rich glycoprotein family protein [Thalictrum thalictroides]|uniref:Hydroxyproline-rich glycoprotein family protein n=1 Tax=Thalictrum thalictroides TaxID=46969 RepID=A0A7J6VBB7_THATH|nr:hydroxyproline-rich glycoprotein family protein [Thalictrum thalictroides]